MGHTLVLDDFSSEMFKSLDLAEFHPQILGARREKEKLCPGEKQQGKRVLLVHLPAFAKGVLQVPQLACKSQDYLI